MGWAGLTILMGVLLQPETRANPEETAVVTGTVKLAWDLSWEPNIAGYRVYYGLESGNYTETLDVSYQVKAELTGLLVGETYYSAVTAYNTSGLESDYSNEISFTVSAPPENPEGSTSGDSDDDGLSDYFETSYGGGEDLDPLSDLDGDGLIALGEFAHGLDPTKPHDRPHLQTEIIQADDERYLCLRYLIDPLASRFVVIHPERSTDVSGPDSWQTGQTVQVSSSPSEQYPDLIEIVERSLSPVTAQAREFLRFRYEVVVP